MLKVFTLIHFLSGRSLNGDVMTNLDAMESPKTFETQSDIFKYLNKVLDKVISVGCPVIPELIKSKSI